MTSKPFARLLPALAAAVAAGVFTASAAAQVLDHKSISILSSGGAGGAGASTSDMVFSSYSSDGWGWAGGAGGVQGSQAVNNFGGTVTAANETFKFNLGATVDLLNSTYGAGAWTVANATLSFASSYAVQNNSRFGRGAGSFDIYWVGNDAWAQSKGTPGDKQANPIYASTASALSAWSGTQSLLSVASFSNAGTGYVNLSFALGSDTAFVNDILSASASGGNTAASLYLMGTSDTLGMIIFTGGQGQPLPTLSFDVVSVMAVPEPTTWALMLLGLGGVVAASRRRSRA